MKRIKNNILAGIGRAIGYALVYGAIALTLYALGIRVDISQVPPTLELVGEITNSFNN